MSESYDEKTKTWRGASITYPFTPDYMYSDLMFEKFSEDPHRVVQICADDDTQLTCEELKVSSIRVAQNLIKAGVKPNDVIGLITHQSHTTTILITGIVFAGALANPLDAQFDEKDIRAVYSKTKPRIIVCDPEAISKVQNALNGVNFVYRIYSTSSEDSKFLKVTDLLLPTGIEDKFEPLRFDEPAEEKILAILCTSGTTGSPKGSCVSHATYLSGTLLVKMFASNSRSTCLSPLYWSTGFYQNLQLAVAPGIRIFTKELFSVEMIIKMCEKYEINSIILPPSHLIQLFESEKFLSCKNESLTNIMVGGSIVPNVLRKKFTEIFPNRVMSVPYGMTEVGISITKPNEYKVDGSVGSIIFPNTIIKIVDDDGNILPKGGVGEVCAKNSIKFLGYYGDEEASKNAVDTEGYIKTGDIGFFNEDGILCIIDRKKEILKYRGYHVNVSEIENLILSMEGVKFVSVVALPDLYRTNIAAAAVVIKENYTITPDEVVEFVASQFPVYKHLHGGAYIFDELPMTPNGKVLKRGVKEAILKLKEA